MYTNPRETYSQARYNVYTENKNRNRLSNIWYSIILVEYSIILVEYLLTNQNNTSS